MNAITKASFERVLDKRLDAMGIDRHALWVLSLHLSDRDPRKCNADTYRTLRLYNSMRRKASA